MSEGQALAIAAAVFVAFFIGGAMGASSERNPGATSTGCFGGVGCVVGVGLLVALLRLIYLGATR